MRIKIAATKATMATRTFGIATPGTKILIANKIRKIARSIKPIFLIITLSLIKYLSKLLIRFERVQL